MNQWVWSGETALWAGTALFFVLFLPMMIWQFRRFGNWNAQRLIGSAALCLYITALVTYTWLPLPPNSQQWCSRYAVHGIQTEPFAFIGDIRQAFATHQLVAFTILQTLFNIVLFIPWGILARGYMNMKWWQATLTGMLISVFIELTQYTGLWFIYPCAYRCADVDDVITNTTGALIGALLAPLAMFWMPKARQLQATRMEPRKLTWRRSVAAGVIDLSLFGLLTLILAIMYVGLRVFLFNVPLAADVGKPALVIISVISYFTVFIATTIKGGPTGSGSVGENCVWLTPAWRDKAGNVTDGNVFLRVLRLGWALIPTMIVYIVDSRLYLTGVLPVLLLLLFGQILWRRIDEASYLRIWGKEADIRDPEIQALDRDKSANEPQSFDTADQSR